MFVLLRGTSIVNGGDVVKGPLPGYLFVDRTNGHEEGRCKGTLAMVFFLVFRRSGRRS